MSRAQVVIDSVSSPWGPVRIAAGPAGVVAVEMLGTAEGFAAGLERRRFVTGTPSGNEEAAAQARRAVAIIAALLAGEEADAAAVPIDIGDRPTWDRLVLDAVRAIPRGSTAGYGEVARLIGRTCAARAVGGAVGRNPVGLLVPCHRVIAGDGTLGGYGAAAWGGREAALDLKRALLALEGVEVRGRVGARVGDLTAAV
jgi:methylated-DNA-[protein]-cysteine S-methyltransferase